MASMGLYLHGGPGGAKKKNGSSLMKGFGSAGKKSAAKSQSLGMKLGGGAGRKPLGAAAGKKSTTPVKKGGFAGMGAQMGKGKIAARLPTVKAAESEDEAEEGSLAGKLAEVAQKAAQAAAAELAASKLATETADTVAEVAAEAAEDAEEEKAAKRSAAAKKAAATRKANAAAKKSAGSSTPATPKSTSGLGSALANKKKAAAAAAASPAKVAGRKKASASAAASPAKKRSAPHADEEEDAAAAAAAVGSPAKKKKKTAVAAVGKAAGKQKKGKNGKAVKLTAAEVAELIRPAAASNFAKELVLEMGDKYVKTVMVKAPRTQDELEEEEGGNSFADKVEKRRAAFSVEDDAKVLLRELLVERMMALSYVASSLAGFKKKRTVTSHMVDVANHIMTQDLSQIGPHKFADLCEAMDEKEGLLGGDE